MYLNKLTQLFSSFTNMCLCMRCDGTGQNDFLFIILSSNIDHVYICLPITQKLSPTFVWLSKFEASWEVGI